jgi:hypothetical protein
MADIDDLFAKKDKKKKGGKKFAKANTDVIAKNLIETDKKEMRELEKQEKELSTQLSGEDKTVTPQASQEDEEWEEYREHKKDLTGLKIETLTLTEPQAEEEEEETEINEDGELVKVKKDGTGGPWKSLGGSLENHNNQDLNYQLDNSIQNTNVVAGSYVPPHLRSSAPAPRPTPGQRRGKVAAPDISSEVSFPSLSAVIEESMRGYDDGGKFEEVKERGGQQYQQQIKGGASERITLENRFAGLGGAD